MIGYLRLRASYPCWHFWVACSFSYANPYWYWSARPKTTDARWTRHRRILRIFRYWLPYVYMLELSSSRTGGRIVSPLTTLAAALAQRSMSAADDEVMNNCRRRRSRRRWPGSWPAPFAYGSCGASSSSGRCYRRRWRGPARSRSSSWSGGIKIVL